MQLLGRVNSRIKIFFSHAPRIALVVVIFSAVLLGVRTPAFADDTYAVYKTLFNSSGLIPSVPKSTSAFSYQGPLINTTEHSVKGLQFKFSWEFDPQNPEKAALSWDHISEAEDNEQFIVRACSAADSTKCMYAKVPYREDAAPDFWTWDSLVANFNWFAQISNPSTASVAGDIWKAQYAGKTNKELADLLVIFRKADDHLFVKKREINILGIDWFTIGAQGQIDDVTVPWLTLAQNGYGTVDASIWYCAGVPETVPGDINPTNAYEQTTGKGHPDADIQRFGDLCRPDSKLGQETHSGVHYYDSAGTNGPHDEVVPDGQAGRSFFKIAQTTLTLPKTFEEAAQQNSQIQGADATKTEIAASQELPKCGLIFTGTFMGCMAKFAFYVIYTPIAWFARLMGGLFDFFLGYSLSDASYRADFAVRGWQLVRDISNIFFIIILVWTGLSTVFGGKSNMKQVLPNIILNALLINFSLFATRVIIDVSNITARVFYNSMHVCQGKCVDDNNDGTPDNPVLGPGNSKGLSEKIISSFNPQTLFNTSVFTDLASKKIDGVGDADNTSETRIASYFVVVSLLSALILFTIAMMFWKVAFMFLGRVIGLYIAMIFAPFAFLTRNISFIKALDEFSWSKWLNDTVKYATLAPIFVFFLYIIYSFLDSDFLKVTKTSLGSNFLETVIYIAIPMLIIYFMISKGVDIAKKYAGNIGTMVQDGAMKVIGAGVGLAAGGAAFAGRNVLGRGIRAIGKGTGWQNWAAKNADNNVTARFLNTGFNKAQTSSWDLRNAGVKIGKKEYTLGSTLSKNLDLKDTASAVVGLGAEKALGKGNKPGGITKLDKERVEKVAKRLANRIKFDHLTDDEAKSLWEEKKKEKAGKYAEKNWEKHVDEDPKMGPLKARLAEAKTAEAAHEKDLKEATAKGDKLAVTVAESALKYAREDREKIEGDIEDAKKAIISELKADPKFKESDAYKAAEKTETDRLDKYGKIKNASGLEMAMRAEYAEDLRKNSLWLKNGEARYGLGALQAILGRGLAGAFSAVLGGVGLGILGDAINGLSNNLFGDINNKATKKLISDALKSQGRGNTERQLADRIDDLKRKVIAAAKKHTGKTSDKFDDYSQEELDAAILKETVDLEDEIADLKRKIDTEPDEVEKKKLKYKKKEKEDLLSELEDALEEIERKEERLAKAKESKEAKEKKADEGEKPKGDKDDKK